MEKESVKKTRAKKDEGKYIAALEAYEEYQKSDDCQKVSFRAWLFIKSGE